LGPLRKKIERNERLRRKIILYGSLLQKDRELEFNFKVNLIWVGFYLFIWIELIFWIRLFLNEYAMSYPCCH
jgi:hypothetical protein